MGTGAFYSRTSETAGCPAGPLAYDVHTSKQSSICHRNRSSRDLEGMPMFTHVGLPQTLLIAAVIFIFIIVTQRHRF